MEKLKHKAMDYEVDVPTSNESPLHDIAEFAKDAAIIAGSAFVIWDIKNSKVAMALMELLLVVVKGWID